MSSNHTSNYGLSQWEAGDKVLRADFNADNLKIDGALAGLDTSLSSINTTLGKKLGRSKIVQTYKSKGGSFTSCGYGPPVDNWSEWEFVCVVVHYPGMSTEATPLQLSIFDEQGNEHPIAPLALPGYLVVFMPRYNGNAPAAGFVIANRFVPFSCAFSYNQINQINYATQDYHSLMITPDVVAFGVK